MKIVIIDILDKYNLMKVVNIFDELRSKLNNTKFFFGKILQGIKRMPCTCHPTS